MTNDHLPDSPVLLSTYPPHRLTPATVSQSHENEYFNAEESDIYRGDPFSSARSVSQSSVGSSSSSGSFLAGRRLGALAAVVEQAITRWARGNTSSDSSSSSSSSLSSVLTMTRSQLTRHRRQRSSVSSLHTMQSERDITARITRMKALEMSRQAPREFALYLPPSFLPGWQRPFGSMARDEEGVAKARRITWTTSLNTVLDQLDSSFTKTRRAGKRRAPPIPDNIYDFQFPSHLHYMVPDHECESTTPLHPMLDQKGNRKMKKGKLKEGTSSSNGTSTLMPKQAHLMPKAWFLEVISPTWEDLRAIGKLLHLHPLTLEDILQQDRREKFELFSKLGYYFISFRAIESQSTRNKIMREIRNSEGNDEGAVGEANVYLTVFKEGICCVNQGTLWNSCGSAHRINLEHTDRVRNRIILLEEVVNMSSDWIAHGILDSIVDSFFPYVEVIEKEVMAIEELVYSGTSEQSSFGVEVEINLFPKKKEILSDTKEKRVSLERASSLNQEIPEKIGLDDIRPRFAAPRLTLPLAFRRFRRIIAHRWSSIRTSHMVPSSTTLTLRRMARTRRLVTSLGRLLATKSEVVMQIRKRLLIAGRSRMGNETSKGDELDVAIYLGDVQDHILTLQHSLAHYEVMLSQSHPTYLSQLRTNFATTKSGTDKAFVYLTVVTIAVLCIQTLIGSVSMNVNVPHDNGAFRVFGTVVAMAVIILFSYLTVVRHWWVQAKRRRVPVL